MQVNLQNCAAVHSALRRHENFYLSDGSCIFAVGDYLFNLHTSTFADLSDVFTDNYSLCQPEGDSDLKEGKSDDHPIVLKDISSSEFTYFLEYMYHRRDCDDTEPLQYLIAVLKICTLWNIGTGRRFAIRSLSDREDLDASLQLQLARLYDVDEWVDPAFRELVAKEENSFTDEDIERMGATTVRILLRTICRMHTMRLRIAQIPPEVIHSSSCMDDEQCEKAWEDQWWGGFSRYFLHPDKVFSATAAAVMLENTKIKGMCEDCLDGTVAAITTTKVLDYRGHLISEAVNEVLEIFQACRKSDAVEPADIDVAPNDHPGEDAS